MKLNTGEAWADATSMISNNREPVLVLAGLFLFLPLMVLILALLGADIDFGASGSEPNPELIAEQINGVLVQYWWAILLVAIGQICGVIALLGLLGDHRKPTVRDVIAAIPKLILTIIAAQIIGTIVVQALPLLAGLLPPAVGAVVNILALPVTIYLSVKLMLASAVVVIEKQLNPIKALKGSWELTKGNSFRIFLFFFLITIAAIVIGIVTFLILGLILAAIGGQVQVIGSAVFISAVVAAYYAISYALQAAIYRQLSGPSNEAMAETFE
ncbi:MAG: glycerophosphoryl diester phosphodiesterase membrane domain-containing protein [Pseudomonadota bacterium]